MCKGTILVVDDDRTIQEVVTAALEEEGYDVHQAASAQTMTVARAVHPDLILLDVVMPVMDGATVSQYVRRNAATADIPIVAMTSLGREQIPARMYADAWLRKPFDLDELSRVVAYWACCPAAKGESGTSESG